MPTDAVLQTWKEISDYVGRTERTLQRWEQQFGFPVHRASGKARGSVMALEHEIQEWTRGRPSLVQIRSSARLNPAKMHAETAGNHHLVNPQNQSALQHRAPEFCTDGAHQAVARDAILHHSELLREQRSLREGLAATRAEHKTLLLKLRQTISAGWSPGSGRIQVSKANHSSRSPAWRFGGRLLIG